MNDPTTTIAGFSRIDITPSLAKRDSTPILGFLWERAKRWDAVHDPLFARAAYIEGPSGAVAIVSVDMIGDAVGFGNAARSQIAQSLGLPEQCVMVACTHAHTTPETARLSGFDPDPEWLGLLANGIAEAVAEARERAGPVTLRTAATYLTDVTHNRREGAFERYQASVGGRVSLDVYSRSVGVDTELRMLWAEDDSGRVSGALVNFACHPVAVQTQPLLSADIPGRSMAELEARFGGGAVCLFLNGATGDVNPNCESSFEGVEAVAHPIAEAAFGLVGSPDAQTLNVDVLAGRAEKLTLPRRPTRPVAEIQAEIAECDCDTSAGSQKLVLLQDEMAVARSPAQLEGEVQVLRIGDLAVVGVPGELFGSLGCDIKCENGERPTMVVSCANGYLGYICPELAFKIGGYEPGVGRWSPLSEGSGERIRDAATGLLSS